MTLETLSLRRIFHRFFPRKALPSLPQAEKISWNHLSEEQKKELALQNLAQGELSLLRGNLGALSLFETASQLDPQNALIWYRQGLSFFNMALKTGKKKPSSSPPSTSKSQRS